MRKTECSGNGFDHYPVSMLFLMKFSKMESKTAEEVNIVPKIN